MRLTLIDRYASLRGSEAIYVTDKVVCSEAGAIFFLNKFFTNKEYSVFLCNILLIKAHASHIGNAFPDVNGYQKWCAKAIELQRAMPGTRIAVSPLLEQRAKPYHRKTGADISDMVFE